MGQTEVGIAEDHPLGLVSHECLKRPIVCPCHGRSRCEGVAKVVETEGANRALWYKKAQLFFNAFNLLNTNYYVPAALVNGFHNNPALLMVYPGEPINVFGGVTLTF